MPYTFDDMTSALLAVETPATIIRTVAARTCSGLG
jgi:hypothetical protein